MRNTFATIGVISVLALSPSLFAQDAPPAAKPEAAKPAAAPARSNYVPLKLQVTISRYQGDKKISSLPYSLSVAIGGERLVRFRVGAQVPYATTAVSDGVKTPSYSYRDVGVGIDVNNPTMVDAGLYKIDRKSVV